MPDDLTEVLDELRGQVERYDPARYPVQHATAAFHLGTTLLAAGACREAAEWLRAAADGFPSDGLPVEHAKATLMLGVAARDDGDLATAATCFATAVTTFGAHGEPLEEAAARYNAGLVARDRGEEQAAIDAFAAALEVFTAADARGQAAAAARELGTSQLRAGALDDAVVSCERAIELARRAGDRAAMGAAANILGNVHLTADDPAAARRAFEDAAGAHPRAIRPAEHAMARANLALACERDGASAHAVLAARQALAIDRADPAVRVQARQVLDRLGDDPDALHAVLDDEPDERHVGILRGELARLASAADRGDHDRAWVAGLAARPERATDRAAAWLEVVLEQPPDGYAASVDRAVAAAATLDEEARERVRHAVSRAAVRFHVPQWERLRTAFGVAAEARGLPGAWG